jgi:putative transposase
LKSGETPGYPRFRSKERYDSFTVDSYNFRLENEQFVIVGLGGLKFKTHYKIKGIPKEFRVKRCGGKWIGQVVCDIGPAPEKVAVRNATGIDVGLTTLATLSNGTEIENPRWTKQEEDRLAEANRNLARKNRGSKNRLKAREHLRRVHQRIAGLRNSYLTSVAKQLVSEYDLIAHEDLKISEMAQSKFAKSIMDAAWGQLIWRLNCEAEYAGKWVIPVNPRGTTQLCSGCGEKVPKKIWDRQHDCPSCGLSLGRDHNAALNILRLGESLASKHNYVLASV